MSREKWPRVKKALRQLGISKDRMWLVEESRDYLASISNAGTSLLPDFTLHNHIHSDNVSLLLARLQREFKFQLSEYEAHLLALSAYLHDLGMFFSEERFRQEILPNPAQALHPCVNDCCHCIENYVLEGKELGEQIREVHNLLSAYMLRNEPPIPQVVGSDDVSYLMTICRGHRKADLRAQGCGCYQAEPLGDEVVRVGLLASLLRLADALDFYRDRAPKPVFEHRALDLLKNPVALEHWLKHYFVTAPYVTRQDQSGRVVLLCTVNFRVPVKQINGEAYIDFFRPLFEKHVAGLNESELDVSQYPPNFTASLGITGMQASLAEGQQHGFRDLPENMIGKIEASGCRNVLDFLQSLQPTSVRPTSVRDEVHSHPVHPIPVYDNPFFHRGAIKDQAYFFGRERETREILKSINRGQCVSIAGPWHIGKTSLLFHIKSAEVLTRYGLAPDRFLMVYCTGQALRTDDERNLYGYLLRKILPFEVGKRPPGVPRLDRSELLELLVSRFDLDEFRTLCFTLQEKVQGLSYDALPSEGLEAKARELISFLARRDQLSLLPTVLLKLRPDLADESIGLLADSQGTLEHIPSVSSEAAYHKLHELLKRLTRRGLRVVLMLDEFELFAVKPNVPVSFFRDLQSLQANHSLTLVTASRVSPSELCNLGGSSLPGNFPLIFCPLDLGLFSLEEARFLITGLSQRAGIVFSERTIGFILTIAGLHPFFLQVACDCVFDRRSVKDRLEDSDYDRLVDEIGRQLKGMFAYYWRMLDPAQQAALTDLKAAQTDPRHASHLRELARQGLVIKKGQSYDYVSTSFREFVRKEQAARLSKESEELIGYKLGSVRLDEEIGSGGMTTVYKAYQPSLERYVAVKVLPRDVQQEGFLQRFRLEAQAVVRLRHPNILSIYDFGQEDDLAYIVMDFVPGGTLADLIGAGLPLKRAIDIAIQIGDALHYAHQQGIVHRDVKPANILIEADGRPLLGDFGLVKFLADPERITKTGFGAGTAAYVAPEQASGEPVDARSDVYALGIVLYEMVTGRLPFEAEDGITMVLKKLQESPPSPSQFNESLPAQVEAVILKAVALRPEDRYQSALEMTEALRDCRHVLD